MEVHNKIDEKKCPLCGEHNECGVRDGNCWCFHLKVPMELREQIPAEQRGKVCICKKCVEEFNSQSIE
ncbi:cysteine-rich CWC family protein [Paenibacillus sp. N1-5-1-14]|uniref:cysteine-rich CWC family protein n=1 Tax=Paenibacillus radicibacter TaxID=2972488 RepID=UPI002158FA13|nr:cysteine-rich CWC family protein [Paenibacillus radicibacter]MCR8641653.1 cysteine-rich CWC family protein [Paenibacillus radicibacter]